LNIHQVYNVRLLGSLVRSYMVLSFSSLALSGVSSTFKATILFHTAKQPNLFWQVEILSKDIVGDFHSFTFTIPK